jgi:hypothetical protein
LTRGGQQSLLYVSRQDDPRLSVTVETTNNLTQWTPYAAEPTTTGSGPAYVMKSLPLPESPDGPARWWRIKAEYAAE